MIDTKANIDINEDGTIGGISIVPGEFPFLCQDFIDFTNYTEYKCINVSDYLNLQSWIKNDAV